MSKYPKPHVLQWVLNIATLVAAIVVSRTLSLIITTTNSSIVVGVGTVLMLVCVAGMVFAFYNIALLIYTVWANYKDDNK